MPVIRAPHEFNVDDLFVDLSGVVGHSMHLKCEGFNFAGSIKIKAALEMVQAAERAGVLHPGGTLVESSSGNLGVALSTIAANLGYRFICVTDPRCAPTSVTMMRALGAEVHVVRQPDGRGGYLGTRIARVRELCAADPELIWLNQYANPGNWRAHYRRTAPAIAHEFPNLDVLFVGAGSTGTLMGCARWFRDAGAATRVVAVDAVGSVTFGGPPARRAIPGLGTSVAPALLDRDLVDDVVHVDDTETVAACMLLASAGFLLGGSSGTVLAGALAWSAVHDSDRTLTSVAIAPDLGERYATTVYDETWVTNEVTAPNQRRASQPTSVPIEERPRT
ncbi:2,3-diaminopropionate biosynthesis protein SbnA [Actinoalloteichus hymeniacidonis]|uniref:2,3-diaminopropionate biosynthesis protein SbnA n=1 Tax=Actinoalloteichus hymeniacidonis TaxID=340345 RepID=A0AAC9HRC5_9PSEU|nr:2,3-diaminopropionate biosynthesis protein SbnA [Actinoalloteichus hymeniacidonis]AOS63791.1 2,3-diaminopropionate biosynthesis protein SbnA [Actinoalloteichus hymeniacidonis]MBB5908155.1 cysteine synthase A [Actinoalloteichus hymeniacidonis]